MIVLPMNAKDDDFDGQRKWSQSINADGTISMQDETEYREKGMEFGALEYNNLCAAIQGFTSSTTVFADDKSSVTETDAYGRKKVTVFTKNEDGNKQIIETLFDTDGTNLGSKTTTFSSDKKTIIEEVSR